MAIAVALTDYTPGIRNSTSFFQLLFSGSYGGTTVGDTVDLNTATNPNGLELEPGEAVVPPEGVPFVVSESIGGAYVQFVPNPATPGVYTLLAYAPGGGEVAAGAYPPEFTAAGAQVIIAQKKRSE
jgi:hypothetical protein